MTQIFDEQGTITSVTLVEVGPCTVLEEKEVGSKKVLTIGYKKVTKPRRQKKPQTGFFKKLDTAYFRYTKEIQKLTDDPVEKGKDLGADSFSVGEKINIRSVSIGRGFQGGMKRHNWAGQPKSHGSTTHRRVGSVGASAYPARIVKGHPMPGHYGAEYVTVKNLTVVKVDSEKNILFVQGSCAGPRNSIVMVKKHG